MTSRHDMEIRKIKSLTKLYRNVEYSRFLIVQMVAVELVVAAKYREEDVFPPTILSDMPHVINLCETDKPPFGRLAPCCHNAVVVLSKLP